MLKTLHPFISYLACFCTHWLGRGMRVAFGVFYQTGCKSLIPAMNVVVLTLTFLKSHLGPISMMSLHTTYGHLYMQYGLLNFVQYPMNEHVFWFVHSRR
jgi:hypothetical protein